MACDSVTECLSSIMFYPLNEAQNLTDSESDQPLVVRGDGGKPVSAASLEEIGNKFSSFKMISRGICQGNGNQTNMSSMTEVPSLFPNITHACAHTQRFMIFILSSTSNLPVICY